MFYVELLIKTILHKVDIGLAIRFGGLHNITFILNKNLSICLINETLISSHRSDINGYCNVFHEGIKCNDIRGYNTLT